MIEALGILTSLSLTHTTVPTTHDELDAFNTRILIRCVSCTKDHPILVKRADYDEFALPYTRSARLTQQIFPYLKSEWREMFTSRICPPCWDKQFEPRS